MVFPLGKLFYLALKQVARPISKQLQSTAKNSQLMKNKILIPIGQREFIRFLLAVSGPPLARPVKRACVHFSTIYQPMTYHCTDTFMKRF